ncbi:MAG: 3-dehydroquinate synthase [Clostridia bacterium]|nr:3-dehydroquinate synthase [Clostridia bacterium]
MKTLTVAFDSISYPIHIEDGCLARLGEFVRTIYHGKAAVITDDNVDKFYGETVMQSLQRAGVETCKYVFPHGEQSKCNDTLQKIYAFLAEQHINRGDFIIALGGGVTGDLAGFAAASYLRGIGLVQVPTSLLAQIDSSVGGKVAIDMPFGKNMVGAFYHPKLVLIDPTCLDTLPQRFYYDGMAEAIKYGCIRNKALFDAILNHSISREDLIYECVSIKRDVVAVDANDTGLRMLLNFGHTIGHAIEKYYQFTKFTHGEAVALGMVLMTQFSEQIGPSKAGTAQKVLDAVEAYHLPHQIAQADLLELLPLIQNDKKNIGKTLHVVMLDEIGNGVIVPTTDFVSDICAALGKAGM